MNNPQIPTPLDASMQLDAAATFTANSGSAAYDNGESAGGLYPYAPNMQGVPFALVINVDAITVAGTNAYTIKMQTSPDNSTWTDASATLTLTATGAVTLAFTMNARFVRRVLAVSGNSTPSITLDTYMTANVLK